MEYNLTVADARRSVCVVHALSVQLERCVVLLLFVFWDTVYCREE